MNKVISFPALRAPVTRIFVWVKPSMTKADAILANGVKIFLAKGTVTSTNGPANLHNKATRNYPY